MIGALRFGRVAPDDIKVLRSGLRWLLPDGYDCRGGELVAYCNIGLSGPGADLFADERADLQIALAAPRAGRLRHGADLTRGGYVDRLPGTSWVAEEAFACLEGCSEDQIAASPLYLAGRRFSAIAEDRSGLMTGWHDRVRAWWGDGTPETLVAMGTCELGAFLRGSGNAFEEVFALAGRPMHIVLTHDEPLVPSARVCLEQLARGPDEIDAIRRDFAETFLAAGLETTAADWLFVGALLRGLEVSSLDERHAIVNASGAQLLEPARNLSLSLGAEFAHVLRHRRLGYTLNSHTYRLATMGTGAWNWLRANFQLVERCVADVQADFEALLDRLAGRCAVFVVNMFSSQTYERTPNYRLFDDATYRALGSVRAKQLNLMLHDLARTYDLHIIDQDAIAAELGMTAHVPDGTHASGALNGRLRRALLDAMAARR